jgi:glycosyltransferase involved in cell wall biosynthesis
MPLVSVLVPVRDEAPFLAESLKSLSGQTLSDLEVVVVDDGSEDGSAEIAERHARADARVRVIRQERLGLVAALERARSEAHGALLARHDGDDVALPERLEAQVEALLAEGLAACGCGIEYFPSATEGARQYAEWLNGLVTVEAAARDVFVECPIAHPALVARREAIEAIGGYRERGWAEDYDLVLRLWTGGLPFRNIGRVLVRWRDHPARASRVDARYGLDAFVRCKVGFLRATLLRGREAVIWGAGPVGRSFARELQLQGTGVAAFVDVDPRKIGQEVLGALVVSVEEAPAFSQAVALGAVAGLEPRAGIREAVAAQGRRDGVDFVAVA